MSTSREVVRDAFVTLLEAALVGDGLPVKTVMGSKVETLAGLTPLVAVLSSGTMRKRKPIATPTFYLEIQVWIEQKYPGWTTPQSEDQLDTIEALIAGVFVDNVGTAEWTSVEYTDRSLISEEPMGSGVLYYLEIIPVTISTSKA